MECKVVSYVEAGDHSLFVGEVMEVEVTKIPKGRADDATLWLKKNLEKRYFMEGNCWASGHLTGTPDRAEPVTNRL